MSELLRPDIQMDRYGYDKYYFPAAKNIIGKEINDDGWTFNRYITEFDMLLGVSIARDFSMRPAVKDESIPDDWRQFLIQLAGPYGKAILKAYRIKHKLEKDEDQNVKQD